MRVSDETLHAIIRDYRGIELSAEELALVRPEVDYYMAQLEILDGLELAGVMSGRLLRMPAGDEAAARPAGGE